MTVLSKSPSAITLEIFIDPDLFWFQGHFENLPILAGVAQIDWVITFFQKYISPHLTFSGIQQVKYQQPIFPNELISLSIIQQSESSLLFEYKCNDNIKSKGKLNLTPKNNDSSK